MILEEFGFMISLSFIYAFEYFSVVFGFVFSGFKYSRCKKLVLDYFKKLSEKR